MGMTPVLLVHAKPDFSTAFERILYKDGFEVVACFENHDEACSVAGSIIEPELVLLIEPAGTGPQVEIIKYLRLSYPEAKIVVIGRDAAKVALSAYVEAGANGRLSFAMTRSAMIRALRVIQYGGRLFVSGDGRKIVPEAQWDRRRSLRRATFMPCVIDPGKGRPEFSGRIHELSHAGAKIQVAKNVRVPTSFDLTIKAGLTRRCDVTRRSDGCYCITFADGFGGCSDADRSSTHMGF